MTWHKNVEGEMLDHFLNGVTCPQHSALWLFLGSQYPGGEPLVVELGYSPIQLVSNDWSFATNGKITNRYEIAYNVAQADWSLPVGAWTLQISSSEGWRGLAAGATTVTKWIKKGHIVTFAAGTIGIHQNGREAGIRGHLTNYAENLILNHIFDKVIYPAPTTWIGLLNHDPGESGSYSGNEVSMFGTGYARQANALIDWYHPDAVQPQWVSNQSACLFSEALTDWGTVTYFAIFDTSSGGNMLIYGPLMELPRLYPTVPMSLHVVVGSQLQLPVDSVNIYFSY